MTIERGPGGDFSLGPGGAFLRNVVAELPPTLTAGQFRVLFSPGLITLERVGFPWLIVGRLIKVTLQPAGGTAIEIEGEDLRQELGASGLSASFDRISQAAIWEYGVPSWTVDVTVKLESEHGEGGVSAANVLTVNQTDVYFTPDADWLVESAHSGRWRATMGGEADDEGNILGPVPVDGFHFRIRVGTTALPADVLAESVPIPSPGEIFSVDDFAVTTELFAQLYQSDGTDVFLASGTKEFVIIVDTPDGVPVITSPPTITGNGKVGTLQEGDEGTATGFTSRTYRWLLDGAPALGETGIDYTPLGGDDRKALQLEVTWSNATGDTVAVSAPLAVTHVAPALSGTPIGDVSYQQGTGLQLVATALAFTGQGLTYSVSGAGATIDAITGTASIPTASLLTDAMVTVTATNSGGDEDATFEVSVVAIVPGFPTDIADALWNAFEVTNPAEAPGGVEGHKKLALSSAITFDDEAFQLWWYSRNNANGDTTDTAHMVNVTANLGATSYSSTAQAVPANAHNILYWKRLSDSLFQRASPTTRSILLEGLRSPVSVPHPATVFNDPEFREVKRRFNLGAAGEADNPQWNAWKRDGAGTNKAGAGAGLERIANAFRAAAVSRPTSPIPTDTDGRAPMQNGSYPAYALALAYALTGDETYAAKARDYLVAWSTPGDGVTWVGSPSPTGEYHHPAVGESYPGGGFMSSGLHIGDQMPQFMYAYDLLHTYTGDGKFTSGERAAFQTWWNSTVGPRARCEAVLARTNRVPGVQGDNWEGQAFLLLTATAAAFEDTDLMNDMKALADLYFVGNWRISKKPYGPGGEQVSVLNDDIDRVKGGVVYGILYHGHALGSMVLAFEMLRYAGHNKWASLTSTEQAGLKSAADIYHRWNWRNAAFNHKLGDQPPDPRRNNTEALAVLELLPNIFPGGMSDNFLTDRDSRRTTNQIKNSKNQFMTLTKGDVPPLDVVIGDAPLELAVGPALTLLSDLINPGGTVVVAPALWVGGDPVSAVRTWQRDQDTGTWIDQGGTGSYDANQSIPNVVGQDVRVKIAYTGPAGDVVTAFTNAIGPVVAIEGTKPDPLLAANVTRGTSYYWPTGQTVEPKWFKANFTFSGLVTADPTLIAFEWTTRNAYPPDETDWERFVWSGSAWVPENYPPAETVQLLADLVAQNASRYDFSIHQAQHASRQRVRIRYRTRATAGDPWTPWSDESSNGSGSAGEAGVLKFVIPEPTPVGPPGTSYWKPKPDRTVEEYGAPADLPSKWNASVSTLAGPETEGRFGGEQFQWQHGGARARSNGNKIMTAQDNSHVRASKDGGTSWYPPSCQGLEIYGGSSLAIDQDDSDVGWGMFTAGGKPELAPNTGVWYTDDFGETWTKELTVPGGPSGQQFYQEAIALWPAVRDPALPPDGTSAATATRKVRVAAMNVLSGTPGTGTLWHGEKSGGVYVWTSKGNLPYATYGQIAQLLQHPTAENTLYMVTSTGVWRTTNWNVATPTWTRVTAGAWSWNTATAKPDLMWIYHANPDIMMVAGGPLKLKWTGDGGTTWNTELASFDPTKIAVGALDTATNCVRVYVHSIKDDTLPRVREFNVSTKAWVGSWMTPSAVKSAPGITLTSYVRLSGRDGAIPYDSFPFFLPSHDDPRRCVAFGFSHFWACSDPIGSTSITFTSSSSGSLGSSHHATFFDPTDWESVYHGTADRRARWTNNAGAWFDGAPVFPAAEVPDNNSGASKTGRALVVLPATMPAGYEAAAGRLIIAYGGNTSHTLAYRDAGGAWTFLFSTRTVAQGGGATHRSVMEYSIQAPNKVYCGPNISLDGGTTWDATAWGRILCGMSRQNGNIIYGKTNTTTGAASREIHKSTDSGASSAGLFYSTLAGTPLQVGARLYFWLDPTMGGPVASAPCRAYSLADGSIVGTQPRDLIMITGTPGNIVRTPMNLYAELDVAPLYFEGVTSMAVDEGDPRYIVALVKVPGGQIVWRGHWDAGFTTIAWEDITPGLPRSSFTAFVDIHPLTGEVHFTSAFGQWVYPAPADRATAPAGSIWALLPQPINTDYVLD